MLCIYLGVDVRVRDSFCIYIYVRGIHIVTHMLCIYLSVDVRVRDSLSLLIVHIDELASHCAYTSL